ncbi:hypothetical protein Hte_007987 [Hypoxylon texense]
MAFSCTISRKEGSKLKYLYDLLTQTPAKVCGVDLSGKTAIVTGSSAGIGLECCRQLLDLELTKLILAVRNISKGSEAARNLAKGKNLEKSTIEVWKLDYSCYQSTCSFVERTKSLERLDIVILNAGIMITEMQLNPSTGHEETIQEKSSTKPQEPGRITITSSDAAAWVKFNDKNESHLLSLLDKQEDKVDMKNRMSLSKLLGQMFLVELAKLVPPSVAIINAATPMMVYDSQLRRGTARSLRGKLDKVFRRLIGYKASVGARAVVDAAVKHGEETHGQYLRLQKVKPMAPIVYSPEGERLRALLWKETMQEFSFARVYDILKKLNSEHVTS